jgi:hypothetical protein
MFRVILERFRRHRNGSGLYRSCTGEGTVSLKSGNKNYRKLGTKITNIQEQKLKTNLNKSYKNPSTKVIKIWERKLQKSRNKRYKNFKNMGTKIPKI